jgi:hypothetical protein
MLIFTLFHICNDYNNNSLCAESEQIGAHTMEHMGRQREQLERSAGLIQQSLENTEQARKILKEM